MVLHNFRRDFRFPFLIIICRVWDETFVFDCNNHSDQLHLQLFDQPKPTKRNKATKRLFH